MQTCKLNEVFPFLTLKYGYGLYIDVDCTWMFTLSGVSETQNRDDKFQLKQRSHDSVVRVFIQISYFLSDGSQF